tara:strand:+ start:2993 stop:3493 length:501 start_codon:yes stop_codon:yes gene_type:complete
MDIKYIKQLQIDNLSDKLKNEQLSAGFYIKINSGYTATVRTILSLTEYINSNPKDIDLSVFGEITSFDSSASKQFIVALYQIIAEVKDFAVFQNGANKHQFVQCTENVETISIRTLGGKKITVCVMSKECVDIKYHTDKDSFKIIGFNGGSTPVPHTEVTLTTILL